LTSKNGSDSVQNRWKLTSSERCFTRIAGEPEKLRPTFTFGQDSVDALGTIAPQASTDGKIN
jgi:hypothetical protein